MTACAGGSDLDSSVATASEPAYVQPVAAHPVRERAVAPVLRARTVVVSIVTVWTVVALGPASAEWSVASVPLSAVEDRLSVQLTGGETPPVAQAEELGDDDNDPIGGDDLESAARPAPLPELSEPQQPMAADESERHGEAEATAKAKRVKQIMARQEVAEARREAAKAAAAKREEQARAKREAAEARKQAEAAKRKEQAVAKREAAEAAAAKRAEMAAAKREAAETKREEQAVAKREAAEAAAAKREQQAAAKREAAEAAAVKREEIAAAKREAAAAAAAKREEQAAAKREAAEAADAKREEIAAAKREAAEAADAKREELAAAKRDELAAAKREAAEAADAHRQELAAAKREAAEAREELAAAKREAAEAKRKELTAAKRDASVTSANDGAGTLRINSRPWAQVFVDGSLVGTTPQMRINLKPGAHEVRLVNPQFAMQKTIKVNVRAGESVTRSENLEEQ